MGGDNRAVSRRTLLRALGLTAATGALAVSGVLAGGAASADRVVTVKDWIAARGQRYYIAHRGSGDVIPEHSMPAYQAAVGWGAACLEISVGITADGVLICMHDPTYDRTTTGTGKLIDQPSTVLDSIRIWQPRLGEAWTRNPPRVPLFEDVLAAFGGSVVLAVEAKVPQAYGPMMAMVERMGLRDSVIVKAYYRSDDLATAADAGYPLFCYFGTADDATPDAITRTAGLTGSPARLPCAAGLLGRRGLVPGRFHGHRGGRDRRTRVGVPAAPQVRCDALLRARRPGRRLLQLRLHRRRRRPGDRGRLGGPGDRLRRNDQDPVLGRLRAAVHPGRRGGAGGQRQPAFPDDGAVRRPSHLDPRHGHRGRRVLADAARFGPDSLSLVFGRADDSYYEHRRGVGDGYHVILRADGELALYRHHDGQPDGELLASAATSRLSAGHWAQLRVATTADGIVVSRTDGETTVIAATAHARDGYLHLGRTSKDGAGAFRTLRIG